MTAPAPDPQTDRDALAALILPLLPYSDIPEQSDADSIARAILARWRLVPKEDICPNPYNWPVHAPGHAPRDCQACLDLVTARTQPDPSSG